MVRQYRIIINVVCLAVVFFSADRVHTLWNNTEDELSSLAGTSGAHACTPRESPHLPTLGPLREYDAIIAKDLFRPERTEWKPPADTPAKSENVFEAEDPAPARIYRVYGIVITEDLRQAWMLEEGRRDRMSRVMEGERLPDGWTVSTITSDAVIVARGNETVTYCMIEPGNPKARSGPRITAQRVSSSSRTHPRLSRRAPRQTVSRRPLNAR